MKSPEILFPATRQYCHSNGVGLLHGYDKEETDKIVSILLEKIRAQDEILKCVVLSLAGVKNKDSQESL